MVARFIVTISQPNGVRMEQSFKPLNLEKLRDHLISGRVDDPTWEPEVREMLALLIGDKAKTIGTAELKQRMAFLFDASARDSSSRKQEPNRGNRASRSDAPLANPQATPQ